MKRRKTMITLLVVLAVACVATLIVRGVEEHKEQIQNTDEVILEVAAEDVESLSWTYDDTSLSFHKNDDVWQWDDDEEFPVDEEKIEDLLADFESFGAAFKIEEVEDMGQYGLDDPTCTINFATADEEYEVLLGDYSKMDSQRYVSVGDGNVYLVKSDPFSDFEIELEDTVLNDRTPSFGDVKKITFSGQENYEIDYVEENDVTYCADDQYFTEQDGKTLALDSSNVKQYYNAIAQMNLNNYASYNVTDDELAAWGLDDPELTVTIEYTEEDEDGNETDESFVLHIGENQEELAEKEKAESKDKEYDGTVTAYARVGDSKLVYEITATEYDSLMAAAYDDLRHEEVFTADFDDVKELDITLDGEEYSITSEKDGDDRTYSYNDEEADITNLRTSITDLSVKEFTDAELPDKQEISLQLHLDKENDPVISIEIYRYDSESCLVVVDGETLGLVNRSAVVDMIEDVNDIVL